jgi:hypothetical protein
MPCDHMQHTDARDEASGHYSTADVLLTKRGMDRGEIARVFGVSLASMKCWLKMRREQGDAEPRPIPGPPPSYSPDLNPIEEAFSKIKNLVRKASERTREGLNEAIAEALRAIRPQDVVGWFAHCGCYEPRDQYS